MGEARQSHAGLEFDVLVIDGRSGSGKTSLADETLERIGASGREPQALRLEDLYPGWDGLTEGSLAVATALDRGSYRRYDWSVGRFVEEVLVERRPPLVIEGCGALTAANLAAAQRWAGPAGRVRARWLELPAAERRRRALDRDGAVFAPHWERWAAQEDAHYAVHEPWRLADPSPAA